MFRHRMIHTTEAAACIAAHARRVGVLIAVCGQLLSLAPVAHADLAGDYHKAIKVALSELELGNFVEAHAQFERAHRLKPSARTLRGLAVVAFELKRYVDAEQLLVQAISDPRRPLEGSVKAQTEELLTRTRSYLGTLKLRGAPDAARLLIDDEQTEREDDDTYRLTLGEHSLRANAAGYEPARRRFRIHSEQVTELDLEMATLNVTAAEAASTIDLTKATDAPTADPRDDSSVFESPWLWTAVGVVLAGATVGTVMALSTSDPGTASTYGGTTGVPLEGP